MSRSGKCPIQKVTWQKIYPGFGKLMPHSKDNFFRLFFGWVDLQVLVKPVNGTAQTASYIKI